MNRISLLPILSMFQINAFCQVPDMNTTQSQETKSDPYNVPTPNQSTLGTFGIIPVSPYTGKADISVPIYQTEQRGVALDVKLSYDTSGLLINQLPSWTGHNWSLFAGGAITRKINGRPDEISYKGTKSGRDVFTVANKNNIYVMSNGKYRNPLSMSIAQAQEYEIQRNMTLSSEQENVEMYNNFTNYFSSAKSSLDFTQATDPMRTDSSADIFYFNFLGISGSFFYGNDGNWKINCDQNISVLFEVNDSNNYIESLEDNYWYKENSSHPNSEIVIKQPKVIKGFKLIDGNGNMYIFGGDKNYIEYSMSLAGKCNLNSTEPWNATSWMLKEVRDRFGNILYSFKYSRGQFMTQINNSYSSVTRTAKSGNHIHPVHFSPKVYNATINAPIYLDSITVMDGTTLVFDHDNVFTEHTHKSLYPDFCKESKYALNIQDMLRATYSRMKYQSFSPIEEYYDPVHFDYMSFVQDSCWEYISNMNIEKLKSIRVIKSEVSNDPEKDKIVTLVYDYNRRMHLSSVIFHIGCGFKKPYLYDFEYDRFDSIPSDYLTKKIDQWGYYNGVDYDLISNGTWLLNDSYDERANKSGTIPGVPNIIYGTMGMLKRITYPTGGYCTLDYEQNTCSKYMSANKQQAVNLQSDIPVGGLRIKSISNYDQDNLIGKITYLYNQAGKTRSSGELYTLPKFRHAWEDKDFYYTVDVYNSAVPLSNSFSPTIAYSTVSEMRLDGSKIVYSYSNYSTEKDLLYEDSRFGLNIVTPFDEFSSRQYMCGKLLSETKFDCEGDSIQSIAYIYDTDEAFNRNHHVSTTCYTIHNIFGKVGSRYKLFYFRPGLTSVVVKTKYGKLWVTDETTYNRQHDILTLRDKDESRNVDVWNVISETKKRGNDQYKTAYNYPYLDTGINSNLVQQFYLPVTGMKHYLNGALIGGSKTTFKLMGSYVPAFDIKFASDQNVCDTIVKYISYSSTYRVTELIDRNNVRHNYYWNSKDQLIGAVANGKIVVPSNPTVNNIVLNNTNEIYASKPIDAVLYEYNENGGLARLVAGNGVTSQYGYDSYGRLNQVQDGSGKTTQRYSYNYEHYNDDAIQDLLKCDMSIYAHCDNVPKFIRVNYTLPYNTTNAEIKLIHINSEHIEYSQILPSNIRSNEITINLPDDFWGTYKICLFVNGTHTKEIRISIPNYT